jgi:EF-hand domain pair
MVHCGRAPGRPLHKEAFTVSMDISGVSSSSMLHAMSGASGGMPPQQKMSSLFDKIDSSGSGSVSQAQFDQAFQTLNPPGVFQQQGSDAIFSALDPNGTGSVSKQDFVSGMSQLMAALRADTGPSSAPGPSPADSLAASLQSLNSLDPTSISPNAPPGSLINTTA